MTVGFYRFTKCRPEKIAKRVRGPLPWGESSFKYVG